MAVTAAAIDEAFLAVVQHVPQALLVVLVGLCAVLVLKDVVNGLRRPFLTADKWQRLPLVDRKVLTHNTARFRFALPHGDQELGLPVGQHVSLRGKLPDGEEVMRWEEVAALCACSCSIRGAGCSRPCAAAADCGWTRIVARCGLSRWRPLF